jgi:hypothetical protein
MYNRSLRSPPYREEDTAPKISYSVKILLHSARTLLIVMDPSEENLEVE